MKKILLSLLAFFSVALAQNPMWVNYTDSKIITSIQREGDNIWVGTTGGWMKLNKKTSNVILFNKSNSGLPDNWVTAVAIDNSGNKWIGTYYGGLAKYDGSSWIVYNTVMLQGKRYFQEKNNV